MFSQILEAFIFVGAFDDVGVRHRLERFSVVGGAAEHAGDDAGSRAVACEQCATRLPPALSVAAASGSCSTPS
jgi:hypothetical protein